MEIKALSHGASKRSASSAQAFLVVAPFRREDTWWVVDTVRLPMCANPSC